MSLIESVEALAGLYGQPNEMATRKVADRITTVYRPWIERARFCVLTTVGPEGADGSPRGDDGPVVTELDDRTLAMPDWRGNNRTDSLRNIVRDGRVALLFLVPGTVNTIRVNGRATLSVAPDLLERFARDGNAPRSVILIGVEEVYFQCGRALLRSGLWSGEDQSAGLPTAGEMLRETSDGAVGGAEYDAGWTERATRTLW